LTSVVDLTKEDIQSVVDTLEYDGVIELVSGSKQRKYKPTGYLTNENSFSEIPCSMVILFFNSKCPVFNSCSDNNDISPKSCVYLKEWLDLSF
jgi:DNA-directed RNA polymerase III subunit RPC6